MQNSILSHSTLECTGCGACSAACSKGALSISLNDEGFFAPSVDKSRCVDCGACKNVCYRFQSTASYATISEQRVIGCHSSNHYTHKTTTSGGIGYEIAKWGVENGYKVFGTIYNYERDEAESVIVSSVSELESIKGSKYIQGNTSSALRKFVDIASNDPKQGFIFLGTPCQIFGARELVRVKRFVNDIIFIDLFCHGVPSYLVWNPYVKELRERLGKISNLNFRYKGNGWHQYSIKVVGELGEYTGMAYRDTFYRYFFDNVALNASCFTCSLRKLHTAADLRLGDFLGPQFEHREDGISAVLVASQRGADIMEDLTNRGIVTICGNYDASVALCAQSTNDYGRRSLRDDVISNLKEGNIKDTIHWYFRQLPLKVRLRSFAKRCVAIMPIGIVIFLRRLSRNL